MGAAREHAGMGGGTAGICQFGLAFLMSSCVALGGSHSALPMNLEILILSCRSMSKKKPP